MPVRLLLFLVWVPAVFSQTSTPRVKETFNYSIEWRLITAGKARLETVPAAEPRPGWNVNLHLESVGLVSKLYKVNDDYHSILNQALCAESSQIESHEGSRQRETKVTFNAETKKASYLERDKIKNAVVATHEIDIPACVHDVIGGLFYLRTLSLEPGQNTQIAVSDGKKSVMAKVEALQREDLKTGAGSFKTIKYEIFLFNNVLYRRSARLYIWLSDDRRKLPVQLRVRLAITIGTITLQLEKAE